MREKPDFVISTGAGVAVPFFWLGKLFGCKLVYMEVFDRINSPTLTGRLVYPMTDKFLIQWEEQKRFYPKGEYWGRTF
jgi:UDP-N-acetylglucosamine:LPS N-acetylglucosamine transferase